jgi:hypothetical protein
MMVDWSALMPCKGLDGIMAITMQSQSLRRHIQGWKVASWVALHCNMRKFTSDITA